MALNFPANPANQTPVNTFSPTSTPESSSNGATYIWNGTGWTGSTEGSDAPYLNLTAGAGTQTVLSTDPTLFTGNLLVGGSVEAPNILLNANGSGTFAGVAEVFELRAKPQSKNNWAIRAYDDTNVKRFGVTGAGVTVGFEEDGSTNAWALNNLNARFNYDVKIGNNIAAVSTNIPNIFLNADGSAVFSDYVATANYFSDGDGCVVSTNFNVRRDSGAADALTVYSGGLAIADKTATISGDGSMRIGGVVNTAPNISLNEDGSSLFLGDLGLGYSPSLNAPNSIIRANGKADFGNSVTITNNGQGLDNATLTLKNATAGSDRYLIVNDDINGNPVTTFDNSGNLKIGGTLPASPNISLNAGGSATFAGDVNVGAPNFSSPTGQGIELGLSFVAVQRTTGTVFSAYSGTTKNFSVEADGSASFAGDVQAGGNPDNGLETGVSLRFAGSVYACRASTGQAVFSGYVQGTTAPNVSLYGDGDATFKGTVTATVVPPSDARFKENITPAKPQLADVVALGGILKNYDWNDQAPVNEELRSVRQLGLVAQEVEDICPSLVKDINRTKTIEIAPAFIGPRGQVITEAVTQEVNDSYKGLSTDVLIMKLIGAVAEQSAKIETLEARLDAAGV